MKRCIIIVLFNIISNFSFGQVELFEPQLIPQNQSFGLTVSPNGKELLFVKSYGGRDTLQIFHSKKVNGIWQKPALAFFADTKYKQIDPAFAPDGKAILYNSLTSSESSFDIYITRKFSNKWSKPEKLSEAINTSFSDFYATITQQKNIYFTRRIKSNDIYVSYFVNNNYQKAQPFGNSINTDENESNPYISKDEKFIIFFADYKNGYGDTDLYISFKNKNKWSQPMNLGNVINTKIGEFCPSIDLKNNLFIFSRTEVVNGKRVDNIYRYPLKELNIKQMKRNAIWE